MAQSHSMVNPLEILRTRSSCGFQLYPQKKNISTPSSEQIARYNFLDVEEVHKPFIQEENAVAPAFGKKIHQIKSPTKHSYCITTGEERRCVTLP